MLGFLHSLPARSTRTGLTAALAPGSAPSAVPAPGPAAAPPTLAQRKLTSEADFEAWSVPAGDLVANGRVMKFLVDLRDPAQPEVLFVNGNYTENGTVPDSAKYHYFFARATLGIQEGLEEFNRVTYFSPTKRYAAGVVHTYHLEGAAEAVYGLQFYPQDVVKEQGVVDVLTLVRNELTIPGARFAFVATGSQQTVAGVLDQLAAAAIEPLTIDRVLGSITYLPLNAGEAWGYLQIFPPANSAL